MDKEKLSRVIIAGGGTGGHVFPAIAIAKALNRYDKQIEILFVGALGKMEMEKVPQAGYKIVGLPISGLQRKFSMHNLKLPYKILLSFFKAKRIISKFRPQVVVGVGGYASWPIVKAAVGKKIPIVLQEQNSYPGLVNKLFAKKAHKICVAYENMNTYFPEEKIVLTGNPVRPEIQEVNSKREEALQYFHLNGNLKTVLVVGGSLGALTINRSIENSLDEFAKNNIQLIWQTGTSYYDKAISLLSSFKENPFQVFQFIERMDLAYAAADVVVSRAGAIAVSELCLVKKPVILIPSPNVAEDHQTKNAMALVQSNAAMMIPDNEAIDKLGKELLLLLSDMEKQQALTYSIAKLGFENADNSIVEEILKIVR
jgi:UDP-N-acetylglucosamine--N-acetylmuramyl-(pentapeptide) pyrophosphoryl-undecaprenol N-acetylglucosamine transferase